jgi:hypothetical protein
MSKPKRALAVIKTDLAQQWANTINRLMEETVAGTIAGFVTIGKAFMEARAQLGAKRGFNRLFQGHPEHVAHPLRCGRTKAYMYIALAEDPLTVRHVEQLPDDARAIYDIIKLPAPIRDAALKDGRIHPGMRRHDVRRLAGAVEHGVPRAWDLDAAMQRINKCLNAEYEAAATPESRHRLGMRVRQSVHFWVRPEWVKSGPPQ